MVKLLKQTSLLFIFIAVSTGAIARSEPIKVEQAGDHFVNFVLKDAKSVADITDDQGEEQIINS